MTTHPHENPDNGYAIRISKNLPPDAANLSYVHVDKPTPSKNINLRDYTENIQENKISHNEEVIKSYLSDDGILNVNQSVFKSKTPNVLITNEYANNIEETPLFYKYKSKEPLNINNVEVSVPLSGNRLSKPKYIYQYPEGQDSRFIYEGEKVKVKRSNGIPMERKDVFKIALEKEKAGYFIVVYSARELIDGGYELFYPAREETVLNSKKEIMNLTPIFKEETQEKNYLSKDNYTVIENDDNSFSIKIDKEEGNFLISEKEREPYSFKYQLQSKVKTRIGDKNPLDVNIGVIYLNENIYNAIETTSALKKIVYQNSYMPSFLNFDNPHQRSEGIHEKENSEYWEASMTMPREHWLEYDILIISGHGSYDMRRMNESIRYYLNHGGTLIIESASEGANVLNLKNNHITSISYSESNTAKGLHTISNNPLQNRYYDVDETYELSSISPEIIFYGEESRNDWDVYVHQDNSSPSIMSKKTEDAGQLIYSNMGLMKNILFNNVNSMKLFVNLILIVLENKSFLTPISKEFVYHKDDLYKEEYQDFLGKRIYFNDKSDKDNTQIVAKKIIDENINNKVVPYLPKAYRNWESIDVKIKLFDEEYIKIKNNRLNLSGEKNEFTETTTNAIPGFRYNVFSGNQTTGKHITNTKIGESSYLHVKTTNTQAFFEQELGLLAPGSYRLEAKVKSEGTTSGGIGLYDMLGEPIKTLPIEGTQIWRKEQLEFEIKQQKVVYLRLGAHNAPSNSDIMFSELYLSNKGSVRMNEKSHGGEPLYAYAVSPKGKNNQLVAYEQTYSNPEILIENKILETTLRVRSFVYRWESELAAYVQLIGNEKETPIKINTKDKEVVLGNILEFMPPLYSGVEWSRKQNVFYEIELDDKRKNMNGMGNDDFINLKLYDPTIDKYFYAPDGKWVMGHEDVWHDSLNSTVQIKASTNYYNLIATNNKFSIGYKPNKNFKVSLPYTEDERDRWHLRIRNGSFTKDVINASELEELKSINKENQYDEYLIGEHLYEMPEYEKQAFYPYYGERLINEELALYVNPNKIEVASYPIVINELKVEKERLRPNSNGLIWSSQNIFWDSNTLPSIYLDQNNTGKFVLLTRGYEIDYREGKVILSEFLEGTIHASYEHDNFKVYKRDFKNKNISNELLKTRDGHAFQLKQKNITVMPSPKIYLGEPNKESIIEPSRYWIDYEEGIIYFFERISTRVYASYSYFTEKELTYENVNKNTGEIYLKERISFKDEVYVSYLVEDNTLEYKGYYNKELNQFIHLDLNPSAGHTFSYQTEDEVEELEGYDLLDKEVFVYLLPRKSVYYKKEETEEHTVRHIFHEEQWLRIKESTPEAILIAQIQVRENTNKENIVIMDARRPGGGLKETITDESIERRLGYTSAFWDVGSFDGLAYYSNGVLIIKIPESVLKANGGNFTEDEVKEITNKYIAYGTYVIIEFVKE